MTNVANLNTTVTADASQFNQTMSGLETKVNKFSGIVKGLGLATIAITAYREFDKLVTKFDDIATGATKAGVAIDVFQRLSYVAKYADADVNSVAKSLGTLTKAIYDAKQGVGEASEGFAILGLNLESLEQSNAADRFLTIVEAISKIGDENKQSIIARLIFGNKRAEEVLLLARSNIAEIKKGLEGLNIVSTENVNKIAAFDDSMKKLKDGFTNLFGSILAGISPVIEALLNASDKLLSASGKFIQGKTKSDVDGVTNLLINLDRAAGGYFMKNATARAFGGKASGDISGAALSRAQSDMSGFINPWDLVNTGSISSKTSPTKSVATGTLTDINALQKSSMTELVKSAGAAGQELNSFTKSLEDASDSVGNMVQSFIDGAKNSKTNNELDRILGDKLRDPWEMTAKDQAKNQETLSFFKEFFRGKLSDDQIQDQFSPYFINKQRPDTSNFDRKIQDTFDLITKNPIMNSDKIYQNLNDASKLAISDGMKGVVEELRKMENQKLGIDNIPKVVLQVLASPDFLIKMISTSKGVQLITDTVGNIVAKEATAIGSQ